jgi:hypothetical protein
LVVSFFFVFVRVFEIEGAGFSREDFEELSGEGFGA